MGDVILAGYPGMTFGSQEEAIAYLNSQRDETVQGVDPPTRVIIQGVQGPASSGSGGDLIWLETAVEDYEGEDVTVITSVDALPISLKESLILEDFALFLRQYGDLNHSIRWGYTAHSVDGPVINGFEGVGVAVGDAITTTDTLVARFTINGLEVIDTNSVLQTVVLNNDPRLDGVTDHGALTGLGDDDHPQYALADGTRGDFATTAQGGLADTAAQPGDVTTWVSSAIDTHVGASDPHGDRAWATGELSTKADLVGGLVPSSQLPSYVDDVLEFANVAAFPATGESGKVYLAVDTNLIYRWGGSNYVLTGSDLALGETAATAYRGDRGKTAYDHSQDVTTNPHGVTAAQVGAVGTGDSRLTDARTPTAHKSTHATGGLDALTPADIGAAALASPAFTGTPTAPTATAGTATTQVATTAFVTARAVPVTVISTSDVSKVSDVTPTAHSQLKVACAANGLYLIRANVQYGTWTATPRISLGFGGPTGAATVGGMTALGPLNGGSNSPIAAYLGTSTTTVDLGGTVPFGAPGSSGGVYRRASALIEAVVQMGATAGDLSVIWSQFIMDSTATVVFVGSTLTVTKIG